VESKPIRPTKPSTEEQRERTLAKDADEEVTDIPKGLDKPKPGTTPPTAFNKERPPSPGYGGSDTSPPGTGYSTK